MVPMSTLEYKSRSIYLLLIYIVSYRYQNILSSVAWSFSLLRLRCNRNNDLSEAARKLEKTILLRNYTSEKCVLCSVCVTLKLFSNSLCLNLLVAVEMCTTNYL